jgi:NAD(P)-dependent dehydrogenase (short-subunit alcohol dehydrogenase family)
MWGIQWPAHALVVHLRVRCAANAGLLMLTRHAAAQTAEHGVRVNAIARGSTTPNDSNSRAGVDARHELSR